MATVNLPFPLPGSGPLVGPQGQQFSATASDIDRRDDLLPGCVAIQFRINNNIDGQYQIAVVNDIATTIGGVAVEGIGSLGGLCPVASFLSEPTTYLASGTQTALQNAARAPGIKSATVNMEGASSATCSITTIPVSTSDPASDDTALTMWQFLAPQLVTASGLTLVTGSSVTAVDDFGNSLDLTKYSYILLDNAIPGWLNTYNPNPAYGPLTKQATITGQLAYTENATIEGAGMVPTKIATHQEFSAHCTLCQVSTDTFAYSTASEEIPYGLAGYIYNIENILQFEGTYTIQENEITDMCPMGSCLSLTGSANPDWANMKAPVQSIHYDIAAGRTELRFGVAAHLGAKDMVELNRANRGIRPFYFIGGNVANQAEVSNTSPVSNAQRAPGKGTDQNSQTITHQNLADSQAHVYSYGNPGISIDTRASGQPKYLENAGLSEPTKATIAMIDGSGGVYGAGIRLSLSDISGETYAGTLYCREEPVCYEVDGTPTSGFIMVLASAPYATSISEGGGPSPG